MAQIDIPSRIQSILDRYNLNAQRFAEKIGVKTKQSIYDLLAGRTKTISKNMAQKILAAYPEISEDWLVSGNGDMTNGEKDFDSLNMRNQYVPLLSLDVVAGFSSNEETTQSVERMIPWSGAKDGDFCVHISGDSMQPAIPDGGLVLLRPAPFGDMFDIEFGKVHAVCIDDDRTLLKTLKPDPNSPGNVVLSSLNPDYPPIAIPLKSIRRLYIAKSVKYDI